MGILSDIGSSITGNIESAYIVIKDYRLASEQGGTQGGSSLLNKTAGALTKGINAVAQNATADNEKRFKVQFNPSELVLNSSCISTSRADTQVKDGRQENVSDSVLKPTLDLTVSLMFDDVNVYDAFMADKFRGLSTANGMINVALASKKTWTVQTEVEGFIAAVRNQYTRNITFQWTNFTFTGQLTNVNAQYTMFSPSGRPIRAKVLLRLRHEMDPDVLKNSWYKYFDSAMEGNASNLTNTESKVQNLLNLGF